MNDDFGGDVNGDKVNDGDFGGDVNGDNVNGGRRATEDEAAPSVPAALVGGPITRQGHGLDWNAQGLIAYSHNNVVSFVDESSMQVTHSVASPHCKDGTITVLRFDPEGLRLASGDRMGRIALWDVVAQRANSWILPERNVGWVRELTWVLDRPWLLVALYSTSLVTVYDPATRRQLWRFELSSETLVSLSCDPFDVRRFSLIGSRGFLGSLLLTGRRENESTFTALQIPLPDDRTEQAEGGGGSKESNSKAPASGGGGDRVIKFEYAPGIRDCMYILLAREFLTYDLQYSAVLSVSTLPRGHAKMINFFAQVFGDSVYCLHADGKVTVWRRKLNKQLYIISHMEPLMPPIAASSPTPQILSLKIKPQSQFFPMTMKDTFLDTPKKTEIQSDINEANNSTDFRGIKIFIVSLSDDNRLWHWVVHVNLKIGMSQTPLQKTSGVDLSLMGSKNKTNQSASTNDVDLEFSFQLIGNVFGISSAITTLSTPTPLLLPNKLGVGVKYGACLLALATQNGSVEILDPVSSCIVSSYSLHSSMVRGVRFLSNSKIVSFSFAEIKGKNGGFVNSLCLTCLKSGQTTPFRVLSQPEKSPIKGLRTSSSGRYLIILFRDSPAEVWAMTKTPQLLRSIALPFTALEWSIPELTFPQHSASNPSINSNLSSSIFSVEEESKGNSSEFSESFAFALVNGSLGVFEIRDHRVRDFRPVWPVASFVSVDVLITSMAYRMPFVVLGDRLGNVKVWNVRNGQSFTYSTSRTAIRRIRFCPVVQTPTSRGRVSLLFADRSFSIFDLDSNQFIPQAICDPSNLGLPILEFDWLPLQGKSNFGQSSSPQILCISVIDGSLRLIEVYGRTPTKGERSSTLISFYDRYHPSPISSLSLHPMPLKLALKLLLQIGVKSSWFCFDDKKMNANNASKTKEKYIPKDFRLYLFPSFFLSIGESSAFEILLKSLTTSASYENLMSVDDIQSYSKVSKNGIAARCKFVSTFFGEMKEAHFWSTLPNSLKLLSEGSAGDNVFFKKKSRKDFRPPKENNPNEKIIDSENSKTGDLYTATENAPFENKSKYKTLSPSSEIHLLTEVQDWGDNKEIQWSAMQKIHCHSVLPQDVSIEKRAHEFITIGDYESAVTLFLSSSPSSPSFFMDSLRAITLASSVSPAMHELAIKVVAANMASCSQPLCAIHLLCSVGKYNEACSQLQDLGYWVEASTIAASHLNGSDKSRVMERWADHCLNTENDVWKAIQLFVSAGAFGRALQVLKKVQQPDSAFMFILACHEAYCEAAAAAAASTVTQTEALEGTTKPPATNDENAMNHENEGVGKEQGHPEEVADTTETGSQHRMKNNLDVDEDEVDDTIFSTRGLKLPYALRQLKEDVEFVILSFTKYQFWLTHVCSAGAGELDLV